MKFGDKLKDAISGAKTKYNDSRFTSKLKNADLCLSDDACALVFEEFRSMIGRDKWAIPATGMTSSPNGLPTIFLSMPSILGCTTKGSSRLHNWCGKLCPISKWK